MLDSYAINAYVYGFPLVLMDITRRKGIVSILHMNRFYNQRVLSTPFFHQVVRPNVDTLYSSAWLDLSNGPLLLHVPDTQSRYYLMPMLDAWSNVFASVGARTTGTVERVFTIVGPGWQGELPSSLAVIYAPTNTAWIIGRTQTNGPKDYHAVHLIQNKYILRRPNHRNTRELGGILNEQIIIGRISPKEIVASMDAATFFTLMMNLMYSNPPYPAIQTPEITRELGILGLVPSPTFDFYHLHPSIQRSLQKANLVGPEVINEAGNQLFIESEVNGWSMLLQNMGYYGTNYMQRAVVAMNLFGANIPQDSVYAFDFNDSNEKPLDGHNKYRIHFKPDQTPPVNAFWSITLYNSDGFLVENPIDRYAISPHLGKLNVNPDGSLDVFIQNTSPGKEKEQNWLPAPLGPFNLMLRMYWPQNPVLKGRWFPPVVQESES